MQGTMKCGIYYDVKKVGIEERPIPQITSKDVLVKVLRAGICGSDTGAYNYGGLPYGVFPGMPFGHEFVGRIVEKGADVADDLNIGDIVFVDPTKAKRAGMMVADMCGGFCEYVDVQNAKSGYNVYVLSPDIDLDAAALIEPVSVGTRGATCRPVDENSKVVVLGAGPIGLSAAAGLIARGVKNVTVVDVVDWRLKIAEEIGAKTINTKECDLREKLIEYYGAEKKADMNFAELDPKILATLQELAAKGMTNISKAVPDVDLYIDAAGSAALLSEVFMMSKHGSKFSIVAVYHENLSLSGSNFMSNEADVYGSSGYTHETILEVIDNIEHKKTAIEKIITKKFKHEDFVEAMAVAADKSTNNIKVVLEYDD